MSKKIYITLFFIAVLLTGCNEVDYTLYPEGYMKILSLKDAGVKLCKSGNTVTEYKDSVLVLKGGGEPDSDAFASLKVMTLEDACATFGYTADMIEIIPEGSFSLADSETISLPGNQRSKYVPVVFSPSAIYERELQVQDKMLVLPLELISDTDTINTANNKILYRFDINGPILDWEDSAEESVQIEFMETDFKLGVKVSYHESSLKDFNCGLSDEGLDELVQQYNMRHGTSYELLPEQSFSFEPFALAAKGEKAESQLNLTRTGLTSDHKYLLPLKLENKGVPVEVSSAVKYLIVTNPKYSYRDADRTGWRIEFANSSVRYSYWTVDMILDGNPHSTWVSLWEDWEAKATQGYDDYLYDDSADRKAFDKEKVVHILRRKRNIGDIVIVVNLGRPIPVARIGFTKAVGNDFPWNHDLKACEFYAADSFDFKPIREGGNWANYQTVNDGNDWKKILEIHDVPVEEGDFWYDVPGEVSIEDRTCQYVKIRPTEIERNTLLTCQMAEFYVSEIIAIDGKPINQ